MCGYYKDAIPSLLYLTISYCIYILLYIPIFYNWSRMSRCPSRAYYILLHSTIYPTIFYNIFYYIFYNWWRMPGCRILRYILLHLTISIFYYILLYLSYWCHPEQEPEPANRHYILQYLYSLYSTIPIVYYIFYYTYILLYLYSTIGGDCQDAIAGAGAGQPALPTAPAGHLVRMPITYSYFKYKYKYKYKCKYRYKYKYKHGYQYKYTHHLIFLLPLVDGKLLPQLDDGGHWPDQPCVWPVASLLQVPIWTFNPFGNNILVLLYFLDPSSWWGIEERTKAKRKDSETWLWLGFLNPSQRAF